MKKILLFMAILISSSIYAQDDLDDKSINSPITAKIGNGEIASGVHIVVKGESMYSIATFYNLTVDELCKMNHLDKTQPLKINQSLKVVSFLTSNKSSKRAPTSEGSIEGTASKIHTVIKGESLYSIATFYDLKVDELCSINGIDKTQPLRIGQSLKVGASSNVIKSPVSATQNYKYHTIKRKETLYSISRMYDLTVKELKSLNGLTSNAIAIGARLRVK